MAQNKGQGLAGMSEEEQRDIAQQGGNEVSKDREHMSDIGKKGAAKQPREAKARGGKNSRKGS